MRGRRSTKRRWGHLSLNMRVFLALYAAVAGIIIAGGLVVWLLQ